MKIAATPSSCVGYSQGRPSWPSFSPGPMPADRVGYLRCWSDSANRDVQVSVKRERKQTCNLSGAALDPGSCTRG
jgi:hypothetical protein